MDESIIETLVFKQYGRNPRFTQDSPIYPDVWLEFFRKLNQLDTARVDLILTPHKQSSASYLLKELLNKLQEITPVNRLEIASNGDTVAVKLTFAELIRFVLPMTNWWKNYLLPENKSTDDFVWLKRLVGAFVLARKENTINSANLDEYLSVFEKAGAEFIGKDIFSRVPRSDPPKLWAVSRNRPASLSIELSVPATKADAGRRLFDIDGSGITWAVLDTGIDITHKAFRATDPKTKERYTEPLGPADDRESNFTRIIATYDFTRFRKLITTTLSDTGQIRAFENSSMLPTSNGNDEQLTSMEINDALNNVFRSPEWQDAGLVRYCSIIKSAP